MLPEMILFEMKTWDHVVALIICIMAPLLAITSRKLALEDVSLQSKDKLGLYHSNALLLVVFSLIVATIWRAPGRPLTGLGFDLPVFHPLVPLFILGILMFYCADLFFQYGTKKFRSQTFNKKQTTLAFIPTNNQELIHFTFLAVAAGIGEEIIFRGFLINYLIWWTGNDFSGIITACIASSALFAFLHGYQGLKSIFKIFFVALLFSAVFVYSESLLIVVILHVIIDIISGVISVYFIKHHAEETEK